MSSAPRAAQIREAVLALAADAGGLADLCADGAITLEMAAWALRTSAARFELPALEARTSPADLTGQRVAVMLGNSVPTAPLRAVALPLLRGASRVLVRAPRQQPRFARRVVESLRALRVEYSEPGDPHAFLDDAFAAGVTHVIAYGSDATLASIARDLPSGVTLEAHGHGFGIAVVTAEASIGDSLARDLAQDIAHYDQFGCLSPRAVFVQGTSAVPLAGRLADALADLQRGLPRGRVDAGLAARITQWQGALAAVSEDFHRGDTYSVAALARPAFTDSPGARNITVVAVTEVEHVAALLGASTRYLTCIGVAGEPGDVRAALPGDASPRIVAAGTMQDPPLDGTEDPRPPVVTRGRAR